MGHAEKMVSPAGTGLKLIVVRMNREEFALRFVAVSI